MIFPSVLMTALVTFASSSFLQPQCGYRTIILSIRTTWAMSWTDEGSKVMWLSRQLQNSKGTPASVLLRLPKELKNETPRTLWSFSAPLAMPRRCPNMRWMSYWDVRICTLSLRFLSQSGCFAARSFRGIIRRPSMLFCTLPCRRLAKSFFLKPLLFIRRSKFCLMLFHKRDCPEWWPNLLHS